MSLVRIQISNFADLLEKKNCIKKVQRGAISLFWDTNMATVMSCALLVLVVRCDVLLTFFLFCLSRTVRSTSYGPIQRSRSHFRDHESRWNWSKMSSMVY